MLTWYAVKTLPERDHMRYYGDRYSVEVMLGNNNTGRVFNRVARWDFDNDVWVEADLEFGPDPEDYEYVFYGATHWAFWPTIKLEEESTSNLHLSVRMQERSATEKLCNEDVLPCHICGKVWKRKDAGKWVYYDGVLACIDHNGVKEWYNNKLKMME